MKRNYLILSTLLTIFLTSFAIYAQTSRVNSSQTDADYKIGDLVEAADYRGAWYKSKITDEKDGKYHVHFFGWSSSWDEWVTPDKIRYSNDYDFGREVEAEQNGVWYKALLIDSRYGTEYLVAYVGYDEDEWVKKERIRETGSSWSWSYRIGGGGGGGGKTVEVADGKKWRRAQVLKRRNKEVYVHYEGFDDVWNEWVSVDKIREVK